MTIFMKIEVITYYVLKVIGYIAGFVGPFMVISFTGACELGDITIAQYLLYEIFAFCVIGLSFAVYYLRELILKDCRIRYRKMQRRQTVM